MLTRLIDTLKSRYRGHDCDEPFRAIALEVPAREPAMPCPCLPLEGRIESPGISLVTAARPEILKALVCNALRNLVYAEHAPVLCMLTRLTEAELFDGLFALETGRPLDADGPGALDAYRKAGKPLEKYTDALLFPIELTLAGDDLERYAARLLDEGGLGAVVIDGLFLLRKRRGSRLAATLKRLKRLSIEGSFPVFLFLPPGELPPDGEETQLLDTIFSVTPLEGEEERAGEARVLRMAAQKPAGLPAEKLVLHPASGKIENLLSRGT